MKTIDDYNFKNKKALIRVDFNVPLNKELEVADKSRIEGAKPTIIKILEDGGSAILMSHLGRPEGKEEKYSLKHIESEVSDVLGVKVKFIEDCIGKKVEEAVETLKPGEILLLENLRFYPEEKKGDEAFAEKLSKLGDIYVNDAFGTAHRAHASTTVVAKFFEDKAMGYLLQKEIESLDKVLNSNEKPVTAVLGGAKVSSKITVIENILAKVDHLIIGGGMAFTFVKAKGGHIGESLVEDDKLELALEILKKAEEKNVKVHLPVDSIVTQEFDNDSETKIEDITNITEGWMGLDAGPQSRDNFAKVIAESKIILWNGPLGVFEMDTFSKGTIALGEAIANATEKGAFSLVGGGDSVSAAKKFGFDTKVSYVSTGGGAMLEMLEGKSLPGIEALK
ncbi:phosphoglycerate kinase [Psychroflexus gondwanensis]|jgi:phosphoglycerate kinase|uniref:phosphoglycerate kinase n=1 Tax=Psychroflexus gondwanensis TaxID=251 RepID=UPI0011BDBDEF|nr:phosphoglycerate kinase [Psychroflexus gondwanensis]TXE17023.1 phosphoglycerate kinase [Psychroflexus gondwanensis]